MTTRKRERKTYTIEAGAVKATIRRAAVRFTDWTLKIESVSGGQLLGINYKTYHMTRRSAITEFEKFRKAGFAIKD